MAIKSGVARVWQVKPSADGKRWSAYPAGDKSAGGDPALGVHNSRADISGAGGNPDPAPVTLSGTSSGSTRVIFVGGSFSETSTPTDSLGSTVTKYGTNQGYAGGLWPDFGVQTYVVNNAAGSGSYTVSVDKSNSFPLGEISVAVLEAATSGTRTIVQSQGNIAAQGAGVGYSSPSITTTGPAIIFAYWSGDADSPVNPKDVSASAGWTIIESAFISSTSYVQFAVAYRQVSGAGTYSLTWTPVANQGAVMSMVAVQ